MTYEYDYEGYTEENIKNRYNPTAIPRQCYYKNIAIPIKYGIYKIGGTSLNYTFNEAIMFTPINRNLNLNDRVHKKFDRYVSATQVAQYKKTAEEYAKNVLNKIRTENCKPGNSKSEWF